MYSAAAKAMVKVVHVSDAGKLFRFLRVEGTGDAFNSAAPPTHQGG
jgi:hypothetical protein